MVNRDINERFRRIYTELYNGNATAMAKATFISRSTINSILGIGKKEVLPGYDVIRKIAEMSSPKINIEWLITGEGEMLDNGDADNNTKDTRPRVPYTAAAGTLTHSVDGISESQCERTPRVRNFPTYDFTIIIRGDSMEPEYQSGDEVACRRIDGTSFVQWGKTHVLDTAQGVVMKRIYDDGDKIRCVSYNKDYPDFSIAKNEVYSMNLVVGLIRLA